MICLNMPLYIVAAFLLLTLMVGIYFSRKETSLQGHAVGNKEFATATLVATVLATGFGAGGLIRNVQEYYNQGLYWMFKVIGGVCLGYCITAWLALRMGPFMRHLSLPDSIGHVYGKLPRIVVTMSTICYSIVTITAQVVAISKGISICIGSDNAGVITVFAALILIFYSTFGGIRAVTYTDVIQFATFAIIIPLLAWFMFLKSGKSVAEMMPIWQSQEKFQLKSLLHFDARLINILFILLGSLTISNPTTIQRIYMASSSIQASRVFFYSGLFRLIITFFIIFVSLFVFVDAPKLPVTGIWDYIMESIPPIFRGFLGISMIAMAMSTADSYLNTCSVMISHDMVEVIRGVKKATTAYQLRLLRLSTVVVGLLAMLLAFRCRDLLQLLKLALDVRTPIVDAPLILAIFGFRGTSGTALIGMLTGTLSILAWNKWVAPATGIHGAFPCMLANGLAMMAAHYLFKQPKGPGWIKPDNTFKQIKQENARKSAECKEAIKNAWSQREATLSKMVPSDSTLCLTGIYMITTAILGYWFVRPDRIHWAISQGLVGAFFTSSKIFFNNSILPWFIGLCWLIGLTLYLPLNLLWHWWHFIDPIFTLSLFLTHSAIILWVLPLYLAIAVVATTLLVFIYLIFIGSAFSILPALFPLFIASLFIFTIIICLKAKMGMYIKQIIYLKNQEEIRQAHQLKASLYDAALVPFNDTNAPKGYGSILNQVVRKVQESISFLDSDMPLYKEDLDSIINKFYDWVIYFNRREKAKDHALLQPAKITLDKLMRKVEIALSGQLTDPPRLFVETITASNGGLCPYIICDINQVVYSLVKAILRVGKITSINPPIVKIQLHPTALQFKQADAIDNSGPVFMAFKAVALVITQDNTDYQVLTKVKEVYNDIIDTMDPQTQKKAPPSIDLEQDTIATIVRAHYGYFEADLDQKQPIILLVLPSDVTDILSKMTLALPLDSLTSEGVVTPKEQADSMMALMHFHDHVSKSLCKEDPIDLKIISGLILLLRQHFRFKRHASGQLFYVRSVGIAQLVTDWVFHSPKVIYAALLYELVRRTCLPLSYIKQHYNLGVHVFVSNVLKIDQRHQLEHPSLLYVKNRLEAAIKEEHIQLSVLFIKLAERLYDLRHAEGYIHATEVHHMAQETLNIDVQIAATYLGPEIGQALEKAANHALKVAKNKEEEREKEKNKHNDKNQ